MVRNIIILIISAMLASTCAAVAASELTLSLEAPALDANTASHNDSSKTVSTKKKENTVKVGRVGIVQIQNASIYKSRSSSKIYSTVKIDTPLAIVKETGKWYGVLMINGAVGWIPKKDVQMIGYELVAKKQDLSRGELPSRGGDIARLGGYICDIIRTAMQYSGVSYVYGGTSPKTGMDCSAFVRSVFSQYGINLPRTARQQAEVGVSVPFDQLQPGDRLYFACKNPYPDHCGIYAGNGYFVHCSSRRGGVGIDNLNSGFYARSLVAARRS